MADTTFSIQPAIQDHSVAIVELVKNAFDADAKSAVVRLSINNQRLQAIVSDDGQRTSLTAVMIGG